MFKSFTTKFNSRNASQSSFAASSSSSSRQDPEHVFGDLASTYGLSGGIPSLPSRSSTPSAKSSRHQSPSSSKVALPHDQSYGDLVSTYGSRAGVPCVTSTEKKPKKTSKTSTPAPTPSSTYGSHPSSLATSPKDYELAFSQLSSTYALGGPVSSFTGSASK